MARIWSRVREVLPERHIIVRVDARVRYVTLRTGTQVSALAVLAAFVGWAGFATVDRTQRAEIIATQQGTIGTLERERQRLNGMLAAERAHYSNATSEIERQYGELRRLLATRGELESEHSATQLRLAEVESNYQRTQTATVDLDREVNALNQRLKSRLAANRLVEQRLTEMASALAGATSGKQQETEIRRNQSSRLSAMQAALAETTDNVLTLRRTLNDRERELGSVASARDLAKSEANRLALQMGILRNDLGTARNSNIDLRRRLAATADALTNTFAGQMQAEQRGSTLAGLVDNLENRLEDVRANQLVLLQGVGERARRNIGSLTRTLEQTGVPVDKMLAAVVSERMGQGGPLIETAIDAPEDSFEHVVGTLEQDLTRWEHMQVLLERIPLARPTMTGYISSKFGRRKDPINGRRSVHKGIDIAAPPRTPVYSTAPGIVTFADWNGAYGRMVEVDHGAGFVTRYGHLRSITVKVGDRVAFHDEVGRMGSSGRSTGSHVHYEVEFEGGLVNPEQFLKAGLHVFKVEDAKG
ncbi:MAG: peptidoglycan DD-metalloendopeptidase family protein [Minwuia sp.]|nr:peptidoglycan DD-metalloendopeptidase family protein [Minwuia sp.]